MSRRTLLAVALLVAGAASAGLGAGWFAALQSAERESAAPDASKPAAAAPPSASVDPSAWTIAQGEDATRRHVRDGLKAGDVDPATGRRIVNYHDPMVPGRDFQAPGKSPFMDMMQVPRYEGAGGADAGSVTISPRIRQNLGIRTGVVVEGRLETTVEAVGSVAWNERDQAVVSARAAGYVERLRVRAPLDRVAASAPLAELHLPDWVAAQEEYLAVSRLQGADLAPLRDAARARLRQAGMSEAQIESFVRAGAVQPRITLHAPIAGVVAELMVREGAAVAAGAPLVRLQGTRTVWAEGEIPNINSRSII